jgi:hypothetical protein
MPEWVLTDRKYIFNAGHHADALDLFIFYNFTRSVLLSEHLRQACSRQIKRYRIRVQCSCMNDIFVAYIGSTHYKAFTSSEQEVV